MVLFRTHHADAAGVIRCDVCRSTAREVARTSLLGDLDRLVADGWRASVVRQVCPACAAPAAAVAA